MSNGIERLMPVCEASNVPYDNYGSTIRKDADNRAPCPICKKVVKLKKVSGHGPWPNTIPHHHMGRLAAAAVVDIQESGIQQAAPEMLAILQWISPSDGVVNRITDAMHSRIRSVIAKATGEAE